MTSFAIQNSPSKGPLLFWHHCLLRFGLLQMSDVSRIFPGKMSHLRLIRLKDIFPFLSKLVSSVKVQSGAISCC